MMHASQTSWPEAVQSERVAADFRAILTRCFAQLQPCATVSGVAGHSSESLATCSHNRYPSPDRSAYSPSRPITVFRPSETESEVDIGYQHVFAMHLRADRVNCGATLTTMIGSRLCKRHQSSLRQWQCSAWPVASKAMWNVALQAQAQALWLLKFSVQIAPEQCLPALLQVCCATTQASTAAVKQDNRAHRGRINFGNRRRGTAPAAVLRFGDKRPCSRKY